MYYKRFLLKIFWSISSILLKINILLSRNNKKKIILSKIGSSDFVVKLSFIFNKIRWNDKTLVFMGDEKEDGSYPVPKSINENYVCLSAGVGPTSMFELCLAEKFNIRSYMIDRSVNKPPIDHNNFNFQKLFLADQDSEGNISMETWISPFKNIIMQLDIEGAEYDVLNNLGKNFYEKVSILIIEFHYIESFLNEDRFNYLSDIISNLKNTFWLVYCRHNDTCPVYNIGAYPIPNAAEVLFLNKKYWYEDGSLR